MEVLNIPKPHAGGERLRYAFTFTTIGLVLVLQLWRWMRGCSGFGSDGGCCGGVGLRGGWFFGFNFCGIGPGSVSGSLCCWSCCCYTLGGHFPPSHLTACLLTESDAIKLEL
eukprot:16919-Amphidinium_carterae.1